jgi:hypothetical protein
MPWTSSISNDIMEISATFFGGGDYNVLQKNKQVLHISNFSHAEFVAHFSIT